MLRSSNLDLHKLAIKPVERINKQKHNNDKTHKNKDKNKDNNKQNNNFKDLLKNCLQNK